MASWNPLLVAIAFRKIDIVRYLLQHLKLSLRWTSVCENVNSEDVYEKEAFGLCLAVANKDLSMLRELWSQYTAWNI